MSVASWLTHARTKDIHYVRFKTRNAQTKLSPIANGEYLAFFSPQSHKNELTKTYLHLLRLENQPKYRGAPEKINS